MSIRYDTHTHTHTHSVTHTHTQSVTHTHTHTHTQRQLVLQKKQTLDSLFCLPKATNEMNQRQTFLIHKVNFLVSFKLVSSVGEYPWHFGVSSL